MSIQINGSTSGAVGGSFELYCGVLGADNLNPSIIYRWIKYTNGSQIQAGTDASTLSFTTIQLSDAANYSCIADVSSDYLTGSITAVASHGVTVQSKLLYLIRMSCPFLLP